MQEIKKEKELSPIKKITLQLGRKEVELTVEEAKVLKFALDELFGKEVIREIYKDQWHWYTHPVPYYGGGTIIWPPKQAEVWCSDFKNQFQGLRTTSGGGTANGVTVSASYIPKTESLGLAVQNIN